MDYNGFTNHETLLIDLQMGDELRELIKSDGITNTRHMKDYVRDEIYLEVLQKSTIVKDFVMSGLRSVNWGELYDLYTEED
jgi:hypothetical protein